MSPFKVSFFFFFFFSCSQVRYLGLKQHHFSQTPQRVIHIQIAGLTTEHLSLLKLTNWTEVSDDEWAGMTCFGQSWGYNMFDLRAGAVNSFWAQSIGKSNVRGTCEDFSERPYWEYLEMEKEFQTYIIENGAKKNESLLKAEACSEYKDKFKKVYFLKMGKSYFDKVEKARRKLFHRSQKEALSRGSIYFDRSCKKEKCFSSLAANISVLFSKNLKEQKNYTLVIREFRFAHHLEKKQIKDAAKVLGEVTQVIQFLKKQLDMEKTLILVSGASSLPIEFPKSGRDWEVFAKTGKKTLYKRRKLLAPVFATGALSENFCGIYEEKDIFKRIFFSKDEKKLFNIFSL